MYIEYYFLKRKRREKKGGGLGVHSILSGSIGVDSVSSSDGFEFRRFKLWLATLFVVNNNH